MAWLFTALSVYLAGGKPVHITPMHPRTADGLQGLVIGGGADIDPGIYEHANVMEEYLKNTLKKPEKSMFWRIRKFLRWVYYPAMFFLRKLLSRKLAFGLDKDRDHLELQLLDQAVKKNLPVMGICRGAQLMNVFFRGSLHQNLDPFYIEEPNPASVFPVKQVFLKPGSKLEQVLGTNEIRVNALHNQAVKEPGQNVEIVAREANQVVQGIEHKGQDFMIGLQWHPEYLVQSKLHRRIFKALVQKAREVNQQIEETELQTALQQPPVGKIKEIETKLDQGKS